MSMQSPLIFTDLDGTLLDHHSYELTSARATLDMLENKQVPVIPNTSKTFAELLALRKIHEMNEPFICENGAVVYIPLSYFPQKPKGAIVQNGYWMKAFTHPRQYWLNLLQQQSGRYQFCYEGFHGMSPERLSALTGLSQQQASLAQQREFGEPLYWLGSDQEKAAFIELFNQKGADVVAGGRFLHVGGRSCKGDAMTWLLAEYSRQYPSQQYTSIALGDGHNDITMLEAADFAVRIKSPVNPMPNLTRDANTYSSTLHGPEGWAECIEKLFLYHFGDISHG